MSRRARLLADMGLVAWQRRSPAAAAHPPRSRVPDASPVPAASASARLAVATRAGDAMPQSGVAATVLAQVLQWLGRTPDQLHWGGPGAVELPATATWSTAAGKRGLWLALKAHAPRD